MDKRAEVQRWLEGYLGRQAKTISSEDVLGSLGYEGDDANEFIGEFATQFQVDMSAFNPWHHFDADEPPFFRRYRPYSADGKALPCLPISASDLETAAVSGRWGTDYSDRELRFSSSPGLFFLTFSAITTLMIILNAVF
jgi:Protein of unknown function (DUF1493)